MKSGWTPTLFRDVRGAVSASDAARFYGLEFDESGRRARCCFHNPDRHPSMTFRNGRFHCWSCNRQGDSIDLVAQLFQISLLEAAKRINEDFRLGLDLDRPPNLEELREQKRKAEARKLFEEWREQMLNELDACIRAANLADVDDLTDAAALALQWRATFEYLADVLLHGNLDNQMQIFHDREGVTRLCKMILQHTPTQSKAA